MQRAQELRVDEFSVQKLRESHETIQRLTSQLQSMQEQMNSLNDSGDFHEEGSNFSGKYSHVPSQPARISSSRSMLSRDKRLQPESWNPPGLQENVFANPRATLGSRACQHRETCGKRGRKNRKHNSIADICKKAADHELLYTCGYSTEFHSWAANSLLNQHFYVGR